MEHTEATILQFYQLCPTCNHICSSEENDKTERSGGAVETEPKTDTTLGTADHNHRETSTDVAVTISVPMESPVFASPFGTVASIGGNGWYSSSRSWYTPPMTPESTTVIRRRRHISSVTKCVHASYDNGCLSCAVAFLASHNKRIIRLLSSSLMGHIAALVRAWDAIMDSVSHQSVPSSPVVPADDMVWSPPRRRQLSGVTELDEGQIGMRQELQQLAVALQEIVDNSGSSVLSAPGGFFMTRSEVNEAVNILQQMHGSLSGNKTHLEQILELGEDRLLHSYYIGCKCLKDWCQAALSGLLAQLELYERLDQVWLRFEIDYKKMQLTISSVKRIIACQAGGTNSDRDTSKVENDQKVDCQSPAKELIGCRNRLVSLRDMAQEVVELNGSRSCIQACHDLEKMISGQLHQLNQGGVLNHSREDVSASKGARCSEFEKKRQWTSDESGLSGQNVTGTNQAEQLNLREVTIEKTSCAGLRQMSRPAKEEEFSNEGVGSGSVFSSTQTTGITEVMSSERDSTDLQLNGVENHEFGISLITRTHGEVEGRESERRADISGETGSLSIGHFQAAMHTGNEPSEEPPQQSYEFRDSRETNGSDMVPPDLIKGISCNSPTQLDGAVVHSTMSDQVTVVENHGSTCNGTRDISSSGVDVEPERAVRESNLERQAQTTRGTEAVSTEWATVSNATRCEGGRKRAYSSGASGRYYGADEPHTLRLAFKRTHSESKKDHIHWSPNSRTYADVVKGIGSASSREVILNIENSAYEEGESFSDSFASSLSSAITSDSGEGLYGTAHSGKLLAGSENFTNAQKTIVSESAARQGRQPAQSFYSPSTEAAGIGTFGTIESHNGIPPSNSERYYENQFVVANGLIPNKPYSQHQHERNMRGSSSESPSQWIMTKAMVTSENDISAWNQNGLDTYSGFITEMTEGDDNNSAQTCTYNSARDERGPVLASTTNSLHDHEFSSYTARGSISAHCEFTATDEPKHIEQYFLKDALVSCRPMGQYQLVGTRTINNGYLPISEVRPEHPDPPTGTFVNRFTELSSGSCYTEEETRPRCRSLQDDGTASKGGHMGLLPEAEQSGFTSGSQGGTRRTEWNKPSSSAEGIHKQRSRGVSFAESSREPISGETIQQKDHTKARSPLLRGMLAALPVAFCLLLLLWMALFFALPICCEHNWSSTFSWTVNYINGPPPV